MKTLQTIQKTCKVFQTLTKIAMILCFVGSGLLLLGLVCGIVISSTGAVISGNMETLYRLTSSASFLDMIGALSTPYSSACIALRTLLSTLLMAYMGKVSTKVWIHFAVLLILKPYCKSTILK